MLENVPFQSCFLRASVNIINHPHWDFLECEDFQNQCVEKVQADPSAIFLIFTNHHPCFTLGRGKLSHELKEVIELKAGDKDNKSVLAYPVHHIHRGGGLTFHHLDQFIVYPIININYWKLQLKDLFELITQTMVKVLNRPPHKNYFEFHWNPLGIWCDSKKVASMGIGLRKGVSFHGLALNLKYHPMLETLGGLAPCGLNVKTYSSLNDYDLADLKFSDLVDLFSWQFLHHYCGKT